MAILFISILLVSCDSPELDEPLETLGDRPIITLDETIMTDAAPAANVDSPAIWSGEDETWVIVTAKEEDVLYVHRASDGALLRKVGGSGQELGQLERPNGVVVVDDLVFVAERDNQRVQVMQLPDFKVIGAFGNETLEEPYGLDVARVLDQEYMVLVTDNVDARDEEPAPAEVLAERVNVFSFVADRESPSGDVVGFESSFEGAFGETDGDGALWVVESINVDPSLGTILIADESPMRKNLKVYDALNIQDNDLDMGVYRGRTVGDDLFLSEPEGIVLGTCRNGAGEDVEQGVWIAVDQEERVNHFLAFDRVTFEHLGTFRGAVTLNTDGIALVQRGTNRPFENGLFAAVDDDQATSFFRWDEIVASLDLELTCPEGSSLLPLNGD
jgi:3-phytase